VTTPEIAAQIHKLMLEYHRILTIPIAKQPGISRELVGFIIHGALDMRTLSAYWVPKGPNADLKLQLCNSSGNPLDVFVWCDPSNVLSSRNLVMSL
jgi:hypothetical protein